MNICEEIIIYIYLNYDFIYDIYLSSKIFNFLRVYEFYINYPNLIF